MKAETFIRTGLVIICLFGMNFAKASSCSSHSGNKRAVLLELFTSEGCSSCPPADRWLGNQVAHEFPPSEVVPLAFHVDYWDYLGWRDPYASSAYTARQYAYVKMRAGAFAYTPQVVLQGQSYADWYRGNNFNADVRRQLSAAPEADLQLTQHIEGKDSVNVVVQADLIPEIQKENVRLYAALFQNDLESNVLRGENGGNRLHHDFVVREFITSLLAPDTRGRLVMKGEFRLPEGADAQKLGVAVFAQDTRLGNVLQALTVPLCNK